MRGPRASPTKSQELLDVAIWDIRIKHFISAAPGICTCDSGCYNWFGVRNVRAANLHATPSSFNGPVGLDPASCSCNRDTDDEQSKDEATCAASLRAVWCICVRAS